MGHARHHQSLNWRVTMLQNTQDLDEGNGTGFQENTALRHIFFSEPS